MKESYTSIVARIDESLKNLKETNLASHTEIIANMRDLKHHVNEELEKFDTRVKKCEDNDKTEGIIYKSAIVVLSILVAVTTILGHFKLI